MVTTRRDEKSTTLYEQRGSGIDLLERKVPASYGEFSMQGETTETFEQARERMQRNLDKLLNYDRYTESGYTQDIEMAKEGGVMTAEREEVVETQAGSVSAFSDEDIKPTTTTLQFGDGEVDKVYDDMQRQKEAQKGSYQLNSKGKLVLLLYSLAVTVILALIVLNTGVLASIKGENQIRSAELSDKMAEYSALAERIESISSDEHVINVAENEYGMIKK